eukprot:CAMPEP_0203761030 /NCGR_PEP_ID=MMETSP0098-20131031/14199_1 /ASSEMBLY_ACC=CAM_ASM_000208 /TAXON_ID=96639 /ORGANISM=" , Strain NY0313808BC1" /LENGTH=339 /DNA_ID=CAMNT_0050654839 /DNA_START=304 /DNA_END=1323 /DNA_ORIENTATION=-
MNVFSVLRSRFAGRIGPLRHWTKRHGFGIGNGMGQGEGFGIRYGDRAMSTGGDCEDLKGSILFIGGGAMAEAIMSGLLDSNGKFDLAAIDPHAGRREILSEKYGVNTYERTEDAGHEIENCDVVVLAVKPQYAEAAFNEMGKKLAKNPKPVTAISIVAGLNVDVLKEGLGIPRVVRSMPNTPTRIREGMTVWCASPEVGPEQRKLVRGLLSTIGKEEFVSDENVLDMATAVSGSGPAYILLCMESMIDAGVDLGLSRDFATRLVEQTVLGTVKNVKASEKSVVALRNEITSPGGTTARALYFAERGGFRTVVHDCVWASYRRSRQLGKKTGDIGPVLNR